MKTETGAGSETEDWNRHRDWNQKLLWNGTGLGTHRLRLSRRPGHDMKIVSLSSRIGASIDNTTEADVETATGAYSKP